MTMEHLMCIEPSDLRAFRVTCNKCGAVTTFQLDQTVTVPTQCVGCNEDWTPVHDTDAAFVAERFVQNVKHWLRHSANAPFRLSFEMYPMAHLGAPPRQVKP
jgi:hypothetical protein